MRESSLVETTTAAAEKATSITAKPSAQAGYGPMAGVIASETERFLDSFLASAKGAAGSPIAEGFLTGFLLAADGFTAKCCSRFASLLREASSQPDVRATPERIFANLVRSRCFASMDETLLSYVGCLKRLNFDLKTVGSSLSESEVRDAIMPGKRNASSRETAGASKAALPQELKASALLAMLQYLKQIEQLFRELLDYGEGKLFGADGDFSAQRAYLQIIQEALGVKLQAAISTVESFEEVKQKVWEEQRAAETATIKAVALSALQQSSSQKTGVGSLVIGAVCVAPVWFVFSHGVSNTYVMGGTFLVAAIGIILFFRGVIRLVKA